MPQGKSIARSHGLGKITAFWSKVDNHFWRGVYLLSVLVFLLPFVSVESCDDSSQITRYYGYELVAADRGGEWLYLFPICMGLAFFGLSFRRGMNVSPSLQGFLRTWKTLLASSAGCVVALGPEVQFLFDTVRADVGQVLGTICWGLVFVASLIATLKYYRRAGRSGTLRSAQKAKRLFLLHILNYVFAGAALVGPVASLLGAEYSWDNLFVASFVLTVFSVPVVLLVCFVAEGLMNEERWAVMWGAFITFLLLMGGVVVSIVTLLASKHVALWVALPASCLLAVVLWSVLSVLKEHRTRWPGRGKTKKPLQQAG